MILFYVHLSCNVLCRCLCRPMCMLAQKSVVTWGGVLRVTGYFCATRYVAVMAELWLFFTQCILFQFRRICILLIFEFICTFNCTGIRRHLIALLLYLRLNELCNFDLWNILYWLAVCYEYLHKINPPLPFRLLNQSIDSKGSWYEHYAVEGNPKTICRSLMQFV
jgi:hypothetical protein